MDVKSTEPTPTGTAKPKPKPELPAPLQPGEMPSNTNRPNKPALALMMTTRARPLALASALVVAMISLPSLAGPPPAEPRGETEAEAPVEDEDDPDAAPSDPDVAKAMAHFAQGVALFEEGDLDGALFEFERAHASAPDYRLLYNIGVTRLETKDYAGAKRALEQYLEQGGDEIAADRQGEVRSRLKALASRVATLTIECDHEGASIAIDGEEVGVTGSTDPLVINLGRRKVRVVLAGFEPYEETLEVGGGATLTVEAILTPVALPSSSDTTADTTLPSNRPLIIGAIVSASVAVALGGGAVVTGVTALRQDGAVERELGDFPAEQNVVDQGAQRRKRLALTTDILIGVSVALAATAAALGTTVILRKRDRKRAPRVSWTVAGVRGNF